MPTSKKQPEETTKVEPTTKVEATPKPKEDNSANAVVSRVGVYTEPDAKVVETKTRNGNTLTTSKG
tara:strand:+ start:220 stop:417 length:198 start_codon:yes stop_codon:yes gene_type:complete